MKKLIITDFFGVVGSEDAPLFFRKHVDEKLGEELMVRYFQKGDLGEITMEEIIDGISLEFHYPREIIKQEFFEGPQPHEEYIALLRDLKKKGHPIVVLSNAPDTLVPYLSNRYQVQDLFDKTYVSSDYHLVKPGKEFFFLALNEMGYQAKDAIFIDDHEENVLASRRLGMEGILFRNDQQTLMNIRLAAEEK